MAMEAGGRRVLLPSCYHTTGLGDCAWPAFSRMAGTRLTAFEWARNSGELSPSWPACRAFAVTTCGTLTPAPTPLPRPAYSSGTVCLGHHRTTQRNPQSVRPKRARAVATTAVLTRSHPSRLFCGCTVCDQCADPVKRASGGSSMGRGLAARRQSGRGAGRGAAVPGDGAAVALEGGGVGVDGGAGARTYAAVAAKHSARRARIAPWRLCFPGTLTILRMVGWTVQSRYPRRR